MCDEWKVSYFVSQNLLSTLTDREYWYGRKFLCNRIHVPFQLTPHTHTHSVSITKYLRHN